MLYITSLTRRGRYIDLNEDVFNYVRDRYFVGEEVEAIVEKHWYDCKVSLPFNFCKPLVHGHTLPCQLSLWPCNRSVNKPINTLFIINYDNHALMK